MMIPSCVVVGKSTIRDSTQKSSLRRMHLPLGMASLIASWMYNTETSFRGCPAWATWQAQAGLREKEQEVRSACPELNRGGGLSAHRCAAPCGYVPGNGCRGSPAPRRVGSSSQSNRQSSFLFGGNGTGRKDPWISPRFMCRVVAYVALSQFPRCLLIARLSSGVFSRQ